MKSMRIEFMGFEYNMEKEKITKPQLIMTSGREKPPEDRLALYALLEANIMPEQIYVVDDKTPYVIYKDMHFHGLDVIQEFIDRFTTERFPVIKD